MPIAVVMESLHPHRDTIPETNVASMGRPRIMTISCNITVVSQDGRWNV
jgi:hypothetical protein